MAKVCQESLESLAPTVPWMPRWVVPLTKRQGFCTVRCREAYRRNMSYFGGRRMEAIGLREGVCQLCLGKFDKWLSAHHVLGKERDPENNALIALCRGCHDHGNESLREVVRRASRVGDRADCALLGPSWQDERGCLR